jgi:hypothetical protein
MTGDPGSILRMVQVTFILINHEILSTVICSVPHLLHVQTKSVKVKATSTGKLLDSLPRNNAVAKLCSVKKSLEPGWSLRFNAV